MYIESPERVVLPNDKEVIFLAGGITGVRDWQSEVTKKLIEKNLDVVICNPRRKHFDEFKNKAGYNISKEQIQWEYDHLQAATQIIFWFEKESLQPIALFELGSYLKSDKTLFIGSNPNYPRKFDLTIQLPLYGYHDPLIEKLEDIIKCISSFNKLLKKNKLS